MAAKAETSACADQAGAARIDHWNPKGYPGSVDSRMNRPRVIADPQSQDGKVPQAPPQPRTFRRTTGRTAPGPFLLLKAQEVYKAVF